MNQKEELNAVKEIEIVHTYFLEKVNSKHLSERKASVLEWSRNLLIMFLQVLLSWLLISCGGEELTKGMGRADTLVYPVKIDTRKATGNKFGERVKWTKVLPLETEANALVTGIGKLTFYKDQAFLLNDPGRPSERFMVFDTKTGAYLREISKHGEGPTDFKGLMDFYLDPKREELVCLVAGKMSMMYYDLSGQLLRSKKTGLFGTEMEKVGSDFLIYNEHSSTDLTGMNYLIKIDQEVIVKDRNQPYPPSRDGLGLGPTGFLTTTYSQQVLFGAPFSDTIYQVFSDGLYPKYIFDLGGTAPPQKMINDKQAIMSAGMIEYSFFGNIFGQTTNSLVFQFTRGNQRKLGIFNLAQQALLLDEARDDFVNYMFKNADYISDYDQNQFVMALSPAMFKLLKENFPDQYEAAREKLSPIFEQIEELPETANPVLLFFEIDWS